GNYGSVIVFLSHLGLNPAIIAKLLPGLKRVSSRFPDRYLSVSLLAHADVRAELEESGFTVFEDPNRAVRAASALARFSASFGEARPEPLPLPVPADARAGGRYTEAEGKQMLAAAGIPVTQEEIVTDANAAARAA